MLSLLQGSCHLRPTGSAGPAGPAFRPTQSDEVSLSTSRRGVARIPPPWTPLLFQVVRTVSAARGFFCPGVSHRIMSRTRLSKGETQSFSRAG
jgi:hypothetical protein